MADPIEITAPITLPPAIQVTAPITLGYKGDKGDRGDDGADALPLVSSAGAYYDLSTMLPGDTTSVTLATDAAYTEGTDLRFAADASNYFDATVTFKDGAYVNLLVTKVVGTSDGMEWRVSVIGAKGDKGDKGDRGDDGSDATVTAASIAAAANGTDEISSPADADTATILVGGLLRRVSFSGIWTWNKTKIETAASVLIPVANGGTGATTLAGLCQTANNLSDLANAATARTNLGLGTSSSPTFVFTTLTGTFGLTTPFSLNNFDYLGNARNSRGNYAVDLQIRPHLNTSVSSGNSSFSAGYANVASGQSATVAGGQASTASGVNSTVGGGNGNTASATDSGVPCGAAGVAYLPGMLAHGSGGGYGSQRSYIQMYGATTNGTATRIEYAGNTAYKASLPNNSAWCVTAKVVARQNTAGGGYAFFERRFMVWRGANAASTVISAVQTVGTDIGSNSGSPPAGWDVAFAADTTNGALSVTVTGAAATNIRWECACEITEIQYA